LQHELFVPAARAAPHHDAVATGRDCHQPVVPSRVGFRVPLLRSRCRDKRRASNRLGSLLPCRILEAASEKGLIRRVPGVGTGRYRPGSCEWRPGPSSESLSYLALGAHPVDHFTRLHRLPVGRFTFLNRVFSGNSAAGSKLFPETPFRGHLASEEASDHCSGNAMQDAVQTGYTPPPCIARNGESLAK
jgi:hypothetical protein